MNSAVQNTLGTRVKLRVKDRHGNEITNVYGIVTRTKADGTPLLVRPEHNLPPGVVIEGVDEEGA